MNEEILVGVLALGVPLFAVGYFVLRKNPGVFRMFAAMLLIGLGYLTATGALTDIGRKIMGAEGEVMPAAAPVTATETPAPAAEAEPPATEPEPEEAAPADEAPAPEAPTANETAPATAPAP